VAAGFILAETADADGCALGDAGDEFDCLATRGVGEEFALVAVEEFLALSCFFGIKLEDLGDEFGFGCECRKPDVEIAVDYPAIFGDSAEEMAGDADAKALFGRRGRADLEGGEVEFLAHSSMSCGAE